MKHLSLKMKDLERQPYVEEMELKRQLELMEKSEKVRMLELQKRELTEQVKKLSEFTADWSVVIEGLTAQVRKLKQEKEALQNELQIMRTEVCIRKSSLFDLLCIIRFSF